MIQISGILKASILDQFENNSNESNASDCGSSSNCSSIFNRNEKFSMRYGFICIVLNVNDNTLNIDNTTNTLHTIRNNKNIALSFLKDIALKPEYLGREVTLYGNYALSNIKSHNLIDDIFEVKEMKVHDSSSSSSSGSSNSMIMNANDQLQLRLDHGINGVNSTIINTSNTIDSSSFYVVRGTLLRMSRVQIFENNSCAIFLAIKVEANNNYNDNNDNHNKGNEENMFENYNYNEYIHKYVRKGEMIIWLRNNAVLWAPFLRIGHSYEINSLQRMRLKQPTTTFEGLASSRCHIKSYTPIETCMDTVVNDSISLNDNTNMNFNDNSFLQKVIHDNTLFFPKSIKALGQYSITPIDLCFRIDRFHRSGMIDVDITATDAITANTVELAIFGSHSITKKENGSKSQKLKRKLSIHIPVWRDLYLLPSLYKGCVVSCSNMLPIYLWGRLHGFALNVQSHLDIVSYSSSGNRNNTRFGQNGVDSEGYCSVVAIWDHMTRRQIIQSVRTANTSDKLLKAIAKAVWKQLRSSSPKEIFESVQSSSFMEFIDLKQIALMRVRGGFDHDWLCSNLPYMLSSNDVYRTLSSTTNCYTSSSQFLSSDDIAGIGSDDMLRVVKSELSSTPRGTGLPQTIVIIGHLLSTGRLSTPTCMLESTSERERDLEESFDSDYYSQATCMFTIYTVDKCCPLSIYVLGATVDLSQVSDNSIVMIYQPKGVISPNHSRSSSSSSPSSVRSDHRPLILVDASDVVILSDSSTTGSYPSFSPLPLTVCGLQVPIVYPSPTTLGRISIISSSPTSTIAHPYSVRGVLMTPSSPGAVSHIEVIGVVIHRSAHEDNADKDKRSMTGEGKGNKAYAPKIQIVLQIRDVEHVDFITMYLETTTNIHEWICPGTILRAKAALYTSKKDGKCYLKALEKPNIIGFVGAKEAERVIASAGKRPDRFKVDHLGLDTNSEPCVPSYSNTVIFSQMNTNGISDSSNGNNIKKKIVNPRVGVVALPPKVSLINLVLDPNPILTHLSSRAATEEGRWRPRITSTTCSSTSSNFENYSYSRCIWSLFGTCDELYSITLGVRCQGCGFTLKREGLICQAWTCLNERCRFYGTNETRANPEISWEAKIKFSDGTADAMMFVHGNDVFKLLQPNRWEAWMYESSSINSRKSRGRSAFELNKREEHVGTNGIPLRKKRKTIVNEVNIIWKLKEYLEKAALRKGRIHISIRPDPNTTSTNISRECNEDGVSNYGTYFNSFTSNDDDITSLATTSVSQLSWPDPWELEDASLQCKCEELTRVIVSNLIKKEQIHMEACICVKKPSSFSDNGTASVMLQRAKLPGEKTWWNEFQSVQMHRFLPIQLRAVKMKRSKPNDIDLRISDLLQKFTLNVHEKKTEAGKQTMY